jgi:hypothetical protein
LSEEEDDRARYEECVKQIAKYDDDLRGWFTEDERIPLHDLVLLVDETRGVPMRRFVDKHPLAAALSRKLAVVSSARTTQFHEFVRLRKEHGSLTDATLDQSLENVCSVALRHLTSEMARVKFYDARPPTPVYIAQILWADIFLQRADFSVIAPEAKHCEVKVDLDDLTELLQKLFGAAGSDPRDCSVPKREWVQEALDFLVEVGLAKHAGLDAYVVDYPRRKLGDTEEYFARKAVAIARKTEKRVTEARLKPGDLFE